MSGAPRLAAFASAGFFAAALGAWTDPLEFVAPGRSALVKVLLSTKAIATLLTALAALLMLAAWGLKKGKAWGQRCLVGALVVLAIQPVLVAAVVLASDATPPPNAALWLSLVVAVSVGWTGFFLYIARKVVGTHPRG